jgi:tRNA threonylcarbamoyl adenosine modification protein (Sua5/YciO/YrdC/YwlC family)
MIAYVVPENPDDRVLSKASQALTAGRLICLPADSNWVVLADPTVKTGVDRLYRIRHVDDHKHFSMFCADIAQASEWAHINDSDFRLLKRLIPGGYTFIMTAQKKTAKHLKASRSDHQIGLRFPPSELLRRLLATHNGPALGSHLNAEMFPDHAEELPIWAGLIDDQFGQEIELVLDPGEIEFLGATTVIDLSGDEGPQLIRAGREPWPV